MNQLTIEELSAYLPYGLKFIYRGKIHELVNIHYFYSYDEYGNIAGKSECTRIYDSKFGDIQILINGIKPLLRPLSQLTTEIEVNGEKFVPIEKLPIIGFESIDLISDIQTGWVRQEDFKLLLSWHFDCFGLIDRNLAEPIV
jgi:hypothetical protein